MKHHGHRNFPHVAHRLQVVFLHAGHTSKTIWSDFSLGILAYTWRTWFIKAPFGLLGAHHCHPLAMYNSFTKPTVRTAWNWEIEHCKHFLACLACLALWMSTSPPSQQLIQLFFAHFCPAQADQKKERKEFAPMNYPHFLIPDISCVHSPSSICSM